MLQNLLIVLFALAVASFIYFTKKNLSASDKIKDLNASLSWLYYPGLMLSGILVLDPFKLNLELFGFLIFALIIYLNNRAKDKKSNEINK